MLSNIQNVCEEDVEFSRQVTALEGSVRWLTFRLMFFMIFLSAADAYLMTKAVYVDHLSTVMW